MAIRQYSSVTFAALAAVALLGGCAEMERRQAPPAVAYNPPAPALAAMPAVAVTRYRVAFANNSAQIDAAGQQSIASAAELMASNSALVATVIGSSDPVGSDAANMALSRKRAGAVHDALLRTGKVQEQRIETRWTGERAPAGAADQNVRMVEIAVH